MAERRSPVPDGPGIYSNGLTRAEWISQRRQALSGHPFYKVPPHGQAKLWRYMDFAKFVSMLDSQALFFARASLLGDAFEGSVTKATLEAERALFRKTTNQIISDSGDEDRGHWERLEALRIAARRSRREFEKDWTFVSCWHCNEGESDAMWKLYGSDGKAIAVQTTYERLARFVESHSVAKGLNPTIGLVNYSAYENEIVNIGFDRGQFFFKRKSFAHECELRIVASELPMSLQVNQLGEQYLGEDRGRTPILGIELATDLNEIIENVYVSPGAPGWMNSLVARVACKYNLIAPVLASHLDQTPIY